MWHYMLGIAGMMLLVQLIIYMHLHACFDLDHAAQTCMHAYMQLQLLFTHTYMTDSYIRIAIAIAIEWQLAI